MDEKETRMPGSIVVKSFKIWEKALSSAPLDQRALERLTQSKRALESGEKES